MLCSPWDLEVCDAEASKRACKVHQRTDFSLEGGQLRGFYKVEITCLPLREAIVTVGILRFLFQYSWRGICLGGTHKQQQCWSSQQPLRYPNPSQAHQARDAFVEMPPKRRTRRYTKVRQGSTSYHKQMSRRKWRIPAVRTIADFPLRKHLHCDEYSHSWSNRLEIGQLLRRWARQPMWGMRQGSTLDIKQWLTMGVP